jgi:hypothetical protein
MSRRSHPHGRPLGEDLAVVVDRDGLVQDELGAGRDQVVEVLHHSVAKDRGPANRIAKERLADDHPLSLIAAGMKPAPRPVILPPV